MMTTAQSQSDQLDDDQLDLIFKALSDRTRRHMLAELAGGEATVSQLAAPFSMSLPAASKHLKVLERAGLVTRTKMGRVHRCVLQPAAMAQADEWLAHYREFWTDRLDALESYMKSRAQTS